MSLAREGDKIPVLAGSLEPGPVPQPLAISERGWPPWQWQARNGAVHLGAAVSFLSLLGNLELNLTGASSWHRPERLT